MFSTTNTCSNRIVYWLFYCWKLNYNLTNICSNISKIGVNLWMVHTCNMKSSGKCEILEEGECALHRWPKSWETCVVLDYFRNFKDKLLLEKLKKEKLKIKNLLKISILDEQEPSVQSADRTKAVQVWCLRNMYFPKLAWKVAVSALSENK